MLPVFGLIMLAATTSGVGVAGQVTDIAGAMAANNKVCASVSFSVTMPRMADDVDYRVTLNQRTVPADTLSPVEYLIEWQSPHGGSDGFTAYFSGNHFRYNGQGRIQEYHMASDSVPFMPWRSARGYDGGVQQTARFVDILPAFVARRLAADASDPRCSLTLHRDTIVGGRSLLAIDVAGRSVGGSVSREREYLIDPSTMLPLRATFENNPGSVSEQTVTVVYDYDLPSDRCVDTIDEQTLMARYPDEFARFRTSNFRIENLRGQPLPSFSLPTTTGERYSRQASDRLRAPSVVAILESGQLFTPVVVKSVRDALAMLPYEADIIWVFTDSHIDDIEEAAGEIRPGEHLLMSGRGLARDCGASMLPSILLVRADGTVGDLIIGFNKDLTTDVIQKMTLLNQ